MVKGPSIGRSTSAWHSTDGDGGNAASQPTVNIYLNFMKNRPDGSDWDNSLRTSDGLTDPEIETIKELARSTMVDAFKGYAVEIRVGTIENGIRDKTHRQADVDPDLGTPVFANGQTDGLFSQVHLGTLSSSFKSAFDCPNSSDCRGTKISVMAQPGQTGFGLAYLVTALGQGIGATAAHEFGHQPIRFTFHNECKFEGADHKIRHVGSCYDYVGMSGKFPRDYFVGKLEWSPQARRAMQIALPRP
jgi:hypothetical protein